MKYIKITRYIFYIWTITDSSSQMADCSFPSKKLCDKVDDFWTEASFIMISYWDILGGKIERPLKITYFKSTFNTFFWQRLCWIQLTSWQNCWTPIKYSFKSLLRRSSSSTTLAYFCWKCTVRGFACDFYKTKINLHLKKFPLHL